MLLCLCSCIWTSINGFWPLVPQQVIIRGAVYRLRHSYQANGLMYEYAEPEWTLKLDSEITTGKYSQRSPEKATGNAHIYTEP